MPYIGQQPTNVAFLTDTFSGNGSTTAFTLSAAPANTSSILVAISGVLQDPSTYSVSGTTLTFSPAPPTGTGNISVRFLGIPASGVTTTAYRTVTEFTATAGQTTFSVPSYTVGFIDVYRNGVLLGSADYTATSGVSVVLALGCTVGDLVEVISFQVSSVLNAIPASPASVGTSYLVDGSVTTAKIASGVTVNFADGSASTPSITNDGDTNTGIFFPAADTIAFAEGGTESARFNSSGNLGIGTATPAEPLHIYSATTQSTVGASDIIRLAGQGTDNTVGARLEVGFNYSSASRQNFATIGFVTTSTAGFCNGDLYFATRSVTTDTAPVEQARITSTGLFQFNSGYGSAATAYGCRAWVNFNGTGTPAIRGSGNVSSITDNGTGNFTLNFTNALSDTNYSFTGMASREISGFANMVLNNSLGDTMTTTQLQVRTCFGNTAYDTWLSCVAVFR
jgi:hypothetical protein